MAETKPIPVRLGDDMIARLDAAAARIGTNRAGVIRFLVDTWLTHFEKRGMASLPPNWEEMLASLDSRTKEARSTTRYARPAQHAINEASSSAVDVAASKLLKIAAASVMKHVPK